jgi:hypothetical protein
MPSSVSDLLSGAGLVRRSVVRWGEDPGLDAPGVYLVSLGADPHGLSSCEAECPISIANVDRLLAVRPELRLDGSRPTSAELARRIAAFWLPDETVLYIGLTKRPVRKRVAEYYRTTLGARSPHAGGWFLKVLGSLRSLDVHVHVARTDNFIDAEESMLRAFVAAVSPAGRAGLHDPDNALPFANLVLAGARKQHGIEGATAPS